MVLCTEQMRAAVLFVFLVTFYHQLFVLHAPQQELHLAFTTQWQVYVGEEELGGAVAIPPPLAFVTPLHDCLLAIFKISLYPYIKSHTHGASSKAPMVICS